MYFWKQILKELRWKLHQGKAQILDMHTCTIKLTVYLGNCSKYLDVLFLLLIYDCKEEEKSRSDLLKVILVGNTFKLEKLTFIFVLGHKHV